MQNWVTITGSPLQFTYLPEMAAGFPVTPAKMQPKSSMKTLICYGVLWKWEQNDRATQTSGPCRPCWRSNSSGNLLSCPQWESEPLEEAKRYGFTCWHSNGVLQWFHFDLNLFHVDLNMPTCVDSRYLLGLRAYASHVQIYICSTWAAQWIAHVICQQ